MFYFLVVINISQGRGKLKIVSVLIGNSVTESVNQISRRGCKWIWTFPSWCWWDLQGGKDICVTVSNGDQKQTGLIWNYNTLSLFCSLKFVLGQWNVKGARCTLLSGFSTDFQKLPFFCENSIYGWGKDYTFELKNSEATTPQPVSFE